MKIKIDKVFVKKNIKGKIINYHKGKERPSWIRIRGLPKDAWFVNIAVGDKAKRYHVYRLWNIKNQVFIPVDYRFEDVKDYYNEFSKIYDSLVKQFPKNIEAGNLILQFLKEYKPQKNIEILDLGAGTGIITELFAKEGYKNLILLDLSRKMLDKAKKKKELKECKFIKQDLKKLKISKKYDVIMSFFSIGLPSYFSEEETQNIFEIIKKHLKKNGLFMLMGYCDLPRKNPYFTTLKKGKMITDKKKGYYFDWYIGGKK